MLPKYKENVCILFVIKHVFIKNKKTPSMVKVTAHITQGAIPFKCHISLLPGTIWKNPFLKCSVTKGTTFVY